MDKVERIINECKSYAQIEEDIRSQVRGLKSQLLMEERSLELLTLGRDNLVESNRNLENLIQTAKEQAEYLREIHEDMRKACLMQGIFEKVVTNLLPDNQVQENQVNRLKNEYTKLLEHYESSSEYQQIVQSQIEDRKLTEKLNETRNDLMKLETQKEY